MPPQGQRFDNLCGRIVTVINVRIRLELPAQDDLAETVGVTVENNREPVLETVRSCLDDLRQDAEVVIKINPEDAEVIRENQDHWLRTHQVDKPVIKEDPTVNRGGCIVETQTGDVDAQIEEQMSKLRAALVDAIRSGNDSE